MAEKPPPPYNPQTAQPGAYPSQQPYQPPPPQSGPYQPPPPQSAAYQPYPQPKPAETVTVVTVGEPAVKWGWGNLVLASISLCCCTCFGLVAILAATLAYVDHKVKDFPRSQKKRKIAQGFAIASIVIGSILFLIIIISGGVSR